jgi:hypothetical protein
VSRIFWLVVASCEVIDQLKGNQRWTRTAIFGIHAGQEWACIYGQHKGKIYMCSLLCFVVFFIFIFIFEEKY